MSWLPHYLWKDEIVNNTNRISAYQSYLVTKECLSIAAILRIYSYFPTHCIVDENCGKIPITSLTFELSCTTEEVVRTFNNEILQVLTFVHILTGQRSTVFMAEIYVFFAA